MKVSDRKKDIEAMERSISIVKKCDEVNEKLEQFKLLHGEEAFSGVMNRPVLLPLSLDALTRLVTVITCSPLTQHRAFRELECDIQEAYLNEIGIACDSFTGKTPA